MATDTRTSFNLLSHEEGQKLRLEIARYLVTSSRLSHLLRMRHEAAEKDHRTESHKRGQ